jgi:outer membrane receptor protein involved in Fe transport
MGLVLGLGVPGLSAQDFGIEVPDEEALGELFQEESAEENSISTALGYAQQIDRTPSNVFVITREQIEAVNPKHPAEMLRFVPGFVVLRKQQFSYEISAFGTGLADSNKVLVMLNGHRVTSPNFGTTNWHLIPLVQDDLERIEVVLGPESTVYGSNAFAAVVNFITRSVREDRSRLTIRSGSDLYNQLNWTSSAKNARGGTRMLVSAEHRGSVGPFVLIPSGTPDPAFSSGDRFTQTMVRVDHERRLSRKDELRLSVGMTRSNISGAIPFSSTQSKAAEDVQERVLLGLNLDHNISPTRQLSFRGSFQGTRAGLGVAPLGAFGVPDISQSSRQLEADLRYHWEPANWKLSMGANLRAYGVSGPYNAPVDSLENKSVYVHGEREIGEKFVLFLGARSIFQERADDVTSWKLAGLYRVRPDLGFRLSVGTSFRAPDFVGLFLRRESTISMGPFTLPLSASPTLPNPGLRSERAKGFLQFGVEKRWQKQRVKLDFYRSKHEGSILARSNGVPVTAFIPPFGPTLSFGTQVQFVNAQTQTVRGLTFAYEREFAAGLHLHLGLNVQDLESPNYAVLDPFAPPRSGSLMLYKAAEGRELGGSLTLTGVDAYGVSPSLRGPGYGMLDVNLERRLSKRTSLLLTVQNLLDREHVEVSYNEIGRGRKNKGIFWGRDAYLTLRFGL